MINHDQFLMHAISIAKSAGDEILKIYNSKSDHEIIIKQDTSSQIAADRIANQIICDELKRITLDIPILSEESRTIPYSERKRWECYWLVDPLDGTKEFINRTGEFTVNIALIKNHRPIQGVVYFPLKDILYFASDHIGAFKKTSISECPISVKNNSQEKLTIVVSHNEKNPMLNQLLQAIGPHVIKYIGSSLKICMIAEGTADLYPRLFPTSEWDTAAAHCILSMAGGELYDIDQKIPLRYNMKASLLNPCFLATSLREKKWLDTF